jgi:glutathione S-transferase
MLELYQFEGCPHCARVREALDALGLDYLVRTVTHRMEGRARVRAVSGQDLVPVLVDPERREVVVESERILDYLEARYRRHA